jgi:hypothetical protein
MALEVIAHSPGCEGGSCPTIWRDTTTGDVRVRGTDPIDPTRERDVDIPAQVWAFLLTQLPR